MSGRITRSVVNGAAWSGISQVVSQGLRFVAGIILWRLLLPDDFGLVAAVAVITAVAGNLIDLGFIEAVVQRREISEKHLSTVFWLIMATGVFLAAIVVTLSPWLSAFFNEPRVRTLLNVSSVIFVIQASGAVHSALLRKKLLFFRASASDAADGIGYLAGAVTAAFLGMGVWSLVIGNISGSIPGVVLRWVFSGWRPSLVFSPSGLRDLWRFGLNNAGMRIVYVIIDKLDFLIIGRFLTTAALGFYSQALRVARIPSDSLGAIGNRIGLPALALVQDENIRLQQGLLKGEAFLAIIGLPVFTAMAAVAPELVRVLQGQQWIAATIPLQILCVSGCVAILNIGIPAVFLAKGRPDINLKLSLLQLFLLLPALLIGVRFGAEGVAAGISGVSLAAWLVRQKYVHQVIHLSFKEYLNSLRPAALSATVMLAALLLVRFALMRVLTLPDIAWLIIEIFSGAVVYLAMLRATKTPVMSEILGLVLDFFRPVKKLSESRVSVTSETQTKQYKILKQEHPDDNGQRYHSNF